jgi:hypothetical protein
MVPDFTEYKALLMQATEARKQAEDNTRQAEEHTRKNYTLKFDTTPGKVMHRHSYGLGRKLQIT